MFQGYVALNSVPIFLFLIMIRDFMNITAVSLVMAVDSAVGSVITFKDFRVWRQRKLQNWMLSC
jgi:hypothetical protein